MTSLQYYTSGTNADLLTEFGHHVKDYLRYASNRADPNAIVGTAIGYMYGIAGFEKDLNKSYHLISKVSRPVFF